MLIIGLAGGSGSGKGVVCSLLSQRGLKIIDTDKIYKKMTAPGGICLPLLAEKFGFDIILADGSLNRKALAKIVFAGEGHTERKRTLEKITHKLILDETRDRIAVYKSEGVPAVVIDAPLLFESGFDKECDILVGVIADEQIRINRIIERDGLTEEQANQRIAAQLTNEYIKEHSDHTILNNGSIEELELQVSHLYDKLLFNEETNK